MTNLDIASTDADRASLIEQFQSATEKTQLKLIPTLIESGEAGVNALFDRLQTYKAEGGPNSLGIVPQVVADIYQSLYTLGLCADGLKELFPMGIVALRSDRNVDYQPLQELMVTQQWLEADKLNNLKLCEIAGETSLARKWIYFSEVISLPKTDLQTINALWLAHSGGRFGYSVQREIWLASGKNWERFWPKLKWKDGFVWTRYPGAFEWNLDSPRGHLPLTNQLRGVQAMNALMNHPAWVA
jgi:GUN4-like/ARM-like repeat domain, GUN4-N terminal